MTNEKQELDLTGLGEVAKAIPPEVYMQTTDTVLTTFNKLVAPITETTDGFGRYIKQKFDNMIDVEKAVATYTLENALSKAESKAEKLNQKLITPKHNKSFIKAIEEASKETDPLLHTMWENLLAEQFVDSVFHPHFVELLAHFSPNEAKLLISLTTRDKIVDHKGSYIAYDDDSFTHWLINGDDSEPKDWNYSCILLNEFRFVDVLAASEDSASTTAILYRTSAGEAFLSAVSP
ncbi:MULTISPECIES: Abi-alpha family protein [Vibrio harveyi group]|uniref:Abi-alpha family protein n=1 Tax=Vibrio harveyi group TaxID=717610 RepID=UPI0009F0FD0E|nr:MULTISPECIES: Abi-alpha family protein [Vibrio harveyi group]EKD1480597.1 DUF4393 domain-containing protein [Vibrio alginolyticus]MCR9350115.1 DUF4393 domain-containing protein [Vibrio alginolyticus]MCR9363151.1 DUF4393 domain-containing protein [Vibrio alginolyticus]OQU02437.1 hypothetical protein EM85_002560 [Vibrio parahaemolyticus]HCM0677295.1 DUF4393 domain-containing protein [Vibrio parahaemolyticus]